MNGWSLQVDWAIGGLIAGSALLAVALFLTERALRQVAAKHAALETRAADHEFQAAELGQRVARLGKVSEARVLDERTRHDEQVGELLGSLLELNEALRPGSVRKVAPSALIPEEGSR
ncbi:MAG TPA: hypothetical protein VHQ90_00555 [Thermoanaerobaculia bacterium]|nr:hypothetical protein [Thermoanaerobaculia bacterium]